MPTSYLPYGPQQMLLPHALHEWLLEGHLAYYISGTVDELGLSAFHTRYGGGGLRNQPFHPAMMVKVLIYTYATGVFSSRKIARKLHEDVAFRVLGAGNFPKHRTLCDFRALHLKELAALQVDGTIRVKTTKDIVNDILTYKAAACMKVRQAIVRRTSEAAERKRLYGLFRADKWLEDAYLRRMMSKHFRHGMASCDSQFIVRSDKHESCIIDGPR